MDAIACPFCKAIQKQDPLKHWKFVNNVDVFRYKCKCGKLFNFYKSKTKSWTIPKPK